MTQKRFKDSKHKLLDFCAEIFTKHGLELLEVGDIRMVRGVPSAQMHTKPSLLDGLASTDAATRARAENAILNITDDDPGPEGLQ